jgi:hypothetical protein
MWSHYIWYALIVPHMSECWSADGLIRPSFFATIKYYYLYSLICDNTSLTTQIFLIFQEKRLKILKYYNFLWMQLRHNCSPAANFANCVMTLHLLKVHLQTFLSIPITPKMPNFQLWHSCRKWAIYCRVLTVISKYFVLRLYAESYTV